MAAHKQAKAILEQLSAAFTAIPFNKMLGLRLDQLEADRVVMDFTMKNELVGNYLQGILHGGVVSSVLDMAGGMVVMASVLKKHPNASMEELASTVSRCSTIDLHINYLNPGKGERFIAKASLTKSGNTISFTHMELFNEDETLIATANGTYLLK